MTTPLLSFLSLALLVAVFALVRERRARQVLETYIRRMSERR